MAIMSQTFSLPIINVAYSSSGSRIACVDCVGKVKVWNVDAGQTSNMLEEDNCCFNLLMGIAYWPTDGSRFRVSSGGTNVNLWDVHTDTVLKTFKGHSDRITSMAFSQDGSKIVSGSCDKTAKVWDINTCQVLLTLTGHLDDITSVAFSPDGSRVISGSCDKTVKLWNSNTGELLKTLKGHLELVTSVAYSPDGSQIASGSYDNTVKMWSVYRDTLKEINQRIYGFNIHPSLLSRSWKKYT